MRKSVIIGAMLLCFSSATRAGSTNCKAIAARLSHDLALAEDGTVWAWGANDSGQLGDGTTVNRFSPVQVSGLSGVVAVVAGACHSLALRSDGSVWAWGMQHVWRVGRRHPDGG